MLCKLTVVMGTSNEAGIRQLQSQVAIASLDYDELFLAAFQQFEEQQVHLEAANSELSIASNSANKRVTRSQSARFALPVSDEELQKKVVAAVPEKTRQQTKWAVGIWMNWRLH